MAKQELFTRAPFLRSAGFHPGKKSGTTRLRASPFLAATSRTFQKPLSNQQHILRRDISTSSIHRIDILESADNPGTAKQSEQGLRSSHATPISEDEYNQRSDKLFEELLEKLEELSEARGDLDIEYSAGVMNITLPNKGTYVLNKQPPNKQIWLSSPESGPKRYDWVIQGESMEHKHGGEATGDWIYLRDGSSLVSLLKTEVGVDLKDAGREV